MTVMMRSSRRGWQQNYQTQPMAQEEARREGSGMRRNTSTKRRKNTRSTKRIANTRLRKSDGSERRRSAQRRIGRGNLGTAPILSQCFPRSSHQTREGLQPHKRVHGVTQNAELRTLLSAVPPTLLSERLPLLLLLKPLLKQIVMKMTLETCQLLSLLSNMH